MYPYFGGSGIGLPSIDGSSATDTSAVMSRHSSSNMGLSFPHGAPDGALKKQASRAPGCHASRRPGARRNSILDLTPAGLAGYSCRI